MSLISVSAPDTYQLRNELRAIRQALRNYFVQFLLNVNEQHSYDCEIEIEYGAVGLSSLELPCVTNISMTTDAFFEKNWSIWFQFDHNDNHVVDFYEMEIEELCDIVDVLT